MVDLEEPSDDESDSMNEKQCETIDSDDRSSSCEAAPVQELAPVASDEVMAIDEVNGNGSPPRVTAKRNKGLGCVICALGVSLVGCFFAIAFSEIFRLDPETPPFGRLCLFMILFPFFAFGWIVIQAILGLALLGSIYGIFISFFRRSKKVFCYSVACVLVCISGFHIIGKASTRTINDVMKAPEEREPKHEPQSKRTQPKDRGNQPKDKGINASDSDVKKKGHDNKELDRTNKNLANPSNTNAKVEQKEAPVRPSEQQKDRNEP